MDHCTLFGRSLPYSGGLGRAEATHSSQTRPEVSGDAPLGPLEALSNLLSDPSWRGTAAASRGDVLSGGLPIQITEPGRVPALSCAACGLWVRMAWAASSGACRIESLADRANPYSGILACADELESAGLLMRADAVDREGFPVGRRAWVLLTDPSEYSPLLASLGSIGLAKLSFKSSMPLGATGAEGRE